MSGVGGRALKTLVIRPLRNKEAEASVRRRSLEEDFQAQDDCAALTEAHTQGHTGALGLPQNSGDFRGPWGWESILRRKRWFGTRRDPRSTEILL